MSTTSSGPRRGAICTFYSFKGGVGRSMALANVAILLARLNRRVLLIDWDLEAPGLERFFEGYLLGSRKRTPGLIDVFEAFSDGKRLDWRSCLLQATPKVADPIDILHAGLDDERYVERLRSIAWDGPVEAGLGNYLEELRRDWKRDYDFILVDSRTGITDIGGICAVHLPDILVSLFTTTKQSLEGVTDVMRRARAAREQMRVNRTKLLILPVPARDESNTEYRLAGKWRGDFAMALAPYLKDWLPAGVDAREAFNVLRIPYVAFWSFGETLPVLSEDAENPKTLAYSFTLIARLLNSRLDWSELKTGQQAAEALAEQQSRADVQSAEAARKREEARLLVQQREALQAQTESERFKRARDVIGLRSDSIRSRLQANRYRASILSLLLACLSVFAALVVCGYTLVPEFHYRVDAAIGYADNTALGPHYAPLYFAAIAIAGGAAMLATFFNARLRANGKSLNRLEREQAGLAGLIHDYEGLSEPDAWTLFASRIEEIAEGERPVRILAAKTAPPSNADDAASAPASPAPAVPSVRTPSADRPPAPPQPTVMPAAIDLVLTYGATGVVPAWLREFLPLLTLWLGEALGREPAIYDVAAAATDPVRSEAGVGATFREVLDRAQCGLVIITRRYLASAAGQEEIQRMRDRFTSFGSLVPVLLDPTDLDLSALGPMYTHQVVDFSEFSFVGEGFSKSERYVAFQQSIQKLATRLAEIIDRSRAAA